MNNSERHILIFKLESDIKNYFGLFIKEMMFKNIIDTDRKFRADYWIPNVNTIIELNGGQFINGRHNRGGKCYENDLMKSNLANINNLFYLQFTYEMIKRNEYLEIFDKLKFYYLHF